MNENRRQQNEKDQREPKMSLQESSGTNLQIWSSRVSYANAWVGLVQRKFPSAKTEAKMAWPWVSKPYTYAQAWVSREVKFLVSFYKPNFLWNDSLDSI